MKIINPSLTLVFMMIFGSVLQPAAPAIGGAGVDGMADIRSHLFYRKWSPVAEKQIEEMKATFMHFITHTDFSPFVTSKDKVDERARWVADMDIDPLPADFYATVDSDLERMCQGVLALAEFARTSVPSATVRPSAEVITQATAACNAVKRYFDEKYSQARQELEAHITTLLGITE